MARRDRESVYDSDTHDLLFGADDHHDGHLDGHGGHPDAPRPDGYPDRPRPAARPSRVETRRADRSRRNRRTVGIMAAVVVVVVAVAVYFIGVPLYGYLNPDDYDGAGSGSVIVTVHANDGASEIGTTLENSGVVASQRAFTSAADDDSRSQNIQAGSYKLRHHMSASAALGLLLDPASRVNSATVVPEGANILTVTSRLAAPRCTNAQPTSRGCGVGASAAAVTKVLGNVRALGIPTDYLPNGKNPSSVEGFLYPATYNFDEETSPTEAVQQMVGKFTDVVRADSFSAKAKKLGLTPYQALIVASMAQAEAKFPADMPKVVRVILNRLKAKDALKIDATSVYAAELKGLDPKDTNFATFPSPYNTYLNKGLPPTPIGNPGSEALDAAVNPASGNWVFYVNGDAEGHLFFTASEAAFAQAQKKCHDNGWGCAAP